MKTKKTFLNLITDVIPLVIVSLLGIFKVKLFLQVLGTETLGLYQLFSNIMIYVALVDGGLASAVLYALYKPNVEKDHKKFNALLAGAFKTFSLIGMTVFAIAFVVSFFVIFFIKNCSFDYWYIVLTFLLFSLSNVVNYFFVPYNALLEVKEKKYIFNLTSQIGQITLSITEIVMLLLGSKFTYILLMHSIIKLGANLVEAYICKKIFPDIRIRQKEKDFSFKNNLKPLMFHKINGLVSSNIDTLIISTTLGLNYVAIYSTYYYIINMLKNILGKLSGSMIAIVGNYLVKTKNKIYDLYQEFNSMLFYIAIIICVPLALAINSFIDIFYEGEIVTSTMIALSFVAVMFVFIIKMDTVLFVNAGGLYVETKYCALTDTIINLILSLTLVHVFGISGVIMATAISAFIAEYIMKTIVVHKKIFEVSANNYFIKNLKFFIVFIIDFILGAYLIDQFNIANLFMWFVIFILFTAINALIVLVIFKLFKEDKFMNRVKILLKRG
ncbi:MAG: hypothetical protein IJB71_00770 [Bacilli bacterium]|nr:hypothetical protein [Bacilli bacterium]